MTHAASARRWFHPDGPLPPAARRAVEDMTYELVPMKTLTAQIPHLPAGARVSVTASPAKTLDDTLDLCARLLELGHRPVPHLSARMVRDDAHARALVSRCIQLDLREVFCIGGDAAEPGRYPDAMAFLRDLLEIGSGSIDTVGIAGYPDGHAVIPTGALRDALFEKQALLRDAGVNGFTSTQMCFSADAIRGWLETIRADGFAMPVHLGVAGVVDRRRLLDMGMRLGVGTSLRYLKKNRSGLLRLFASKGYDPSTLIDPLADDFARLAVTGLHTFTFNQVEATRAWQRSVLG
jgi:methylenetetrahydrofolate reductase (NADPH)